MKRIISFILFAVMLAVTGTSGVFAVANQISCDVSVLNGFVYISGTAKPVRDVSLVVFKNGIDKADAKGAEDVLYAEQVIAENDGSFEFKLKVDESKSGIFKCYVKDEKGNEASGEFKLIASDASDADKAAFDAGFINLVYNGTDEEIDLLTKVVSGAGSEVVWSSESSFVKIENGKAVIDRSSYNAETAVIKARAKSGEAFSSEKTFNISITPYTNDERIEKVKAYGNALKGVDTELSKVIAGCGLSWTVSFGECAKIEDGKLVVLRDALTADVDITLTCGINNNGGLSTENFVITVKPYTAEEKVLLDIEEVSVTYNGTDLEFSLPSSGSRFSTEFSWMSSNTAVVEVFNKTVAVTRPAYDTVVTLTLETKSGVTKSFDITVKGTGTGSGSGNGSGGSGGGSGYRPSNGGGSTVTMPSVKTNVEEYREYLYDDISGYEWAKDAITILSEKKIVNGVAENKFAPEKNVTRAEFAKMLAITFDYKADNYEVTFDDVEKNSWYEQYVAAMVKNGAINGLSENEFGTNKNISREDAAVIIYRCMKYTAEEAEFDDADDISEYALEAVGALAKAKIITGYEGKFNPKGELSRAEAAVIINRCIEAGLKRDAVGIIDPSI